MPAPEQEQAGRHYAPFVSASRERVARRCAELWKRLLRDPDYGAAKMRGYGMPGKPSDKDNAIAARWVEDSEQAAEQCDPQEIEAFAEVLRELLLEAHSGERGAGMRAYVDWQPDDRMRGAKQHSGLSMALPHKTGVSATKDGYIYVTEANASHMRKPTCHYPLQGGRWLVSDLEGEPVQEPPGDLRRIGKVVDAWPDHPFNVEHE